MYFSEPEVPDLVRVKYAELRPDWKILEISPITRRFGGFMAIVACDKVADNASECVEPAAREVCYVSAKGDVTCFSDIASFANFLTQFERRSIFDKWLAPAIFFRVVMIIMLFCAALGLSTAIERDSMMLRIAAIVAAIGATLALIVETRE